jgi:hypothetical protein
VVCDERGELPRGGQAGHVPLNGGLLGSSMADVRARGRKAHSQQGVGEGSCIVIVLRRLYTKENKRDTLICGTLVFYCAVLRRGALTFIRFSSPRPARGVGGGPWRATDCHPALHPRSPQPHAAPRAPLLLPHPQPFPRARVGFGGPLAGLAQVIQTPVCRVLMLRVFQASSRRSLLCAGCCSSARTF